MQTVRIEEFGAHVGETVRVCGWIHNKRSSGKLQFVILRDGSGYAQAVVSKKAIAPEAWDALEAAGQESSLEVHRQRARRRARAGRLRDRRGGSRSCCRASTTTRSRPRSTASTS